jgi:hypothetical protein
MSWSRTLVLRLDNNANTKAISCSLESIGELSDVDSSAGDGILRVTYYDLRHAARALGCINRNEDGMPTGVLGALYSAPATSSLTSLSNGAESTTNDVNSEDVVIDASSNNKEHAEVCMYALMVRSLGWELVFCRCVCRVSIASPEDNFAR